MSSLGALKTSMALTLVLLFGFLAGIGGLILYLYGPSLGLVTGIILAAVFAFAMVGIQFWLGPIIIKWMTRMREISPADYPEIHAIVDEVCRASGVKKPRVFLVQDASPNAFAFGRTPSDSNIAVHTGLLNVLNKDEVTAVIAHEIGHIRHWDVAVITLASVVPLLVYYLVILFAPRDDRRGGGMLSVVLVFVGAILAQLVARLLVMHLSRSRESYADAFSAVVTKNPTALQTALAKITYGANPAPSSASQSLRAFYIADPFEKPDLGKMTEESEKGEKISVRADEINHAMKWEREHSGFEFFSSHPMTFKRIDALEALKKDVSSGKLTLKDV